MGNHRAPYMTARLSLTDRDIESLERATLDAVAPPRLHALPYWLVPFDNSTIGRAKSAVPLRHHGLDANDVGDINALYDSQKLPSAFRIADVPTLANIQAALRRLGFAPTQPTLVQVGTVQGLVGMPCDAPAAVSPTPTSSWSGVYTAPGFDAEDGTNRVRALSRSPCVVYAAVCDGVDMRPVAAGTASLSQGWAGIHGMRTVIDERGRGLATRILSGLGSHARNLGIERVFLQVEEDNLSAIALYRRAGFTTAWRYHYWRCG